MIVADLNAHLEVLRANSAAIVILNARIRPDKDNSNLRSKPKDKALLQHVSNLITLQLTEESEIRFTDLLDIVESVGDEAGKLSVVHRLASPDTGDIALVIKAKPMG